MMTPRLARALLYPALVFGFICSFVLPSVSLAVTPITPSGLNTTVSTPITLPSGQTQFNITGGTRPGGGSNLFHSFGNFNVPNNNIANFLNNSGLPTSNILGRVTGGNPSNILGSIQTTGFGNANLFLINPAGFLFGPNATVNVGGMMTFTSADYLRLSDNARFNAIPRTAPDLLLSAAPVAAFGFLGSNPGAITVQGSNLSVTEGAGISLVGGNIAIQDGTLTAPSGQINLVSVGKPTNAKAGGEVATGGGFAATGFKNLGTISLTQGSTLDTSTSPGSGNPAGPVSIRGGQFVMDASSIKAVTTTPASAQSIVGGKIDVTAEQVTLSNQSSISTRTSGGSDFPFQLGAAGDITFNAETFSATDSAIAANVGFYAGIGGAVTIQGLKPGTNAQKVSLTNTQVNTGTEFVGAGGNIAIRAHDIFLNQSTLNTFSIEPLGGPISLVSSGRIESHDSVFTANSFFGSGGPIDFTAGKSIDLTNTLVNTRSSSGWTGGNITMSAPRISINGSTLDAQSGGIGHGGTISITGKDYVKLSGSALSSSNVLNPPFIITNNNADGGTVHIDGGAKFISEQSTISAGSSIGDGGSIHVEAKKATIIDSVLTTAVSGGPQTVGGHITVDAKNVTVKNSQILSTATEGHGGTIEITSHNAHPVINSVIDATSQLGTDGTVTIH